MSPGRQRRYCENPTISPQAGPVFLCFLVPVGFLDGTRTFLFLEDIGEQVAHMKALIRLARTSQSLQGLMGNLILMMKRVEVFGLLGIAENTMLGMAG